MEAGTREMRQTLVSSRFVCLILSISMSSSRRQLLVVQSHVKEASTKLSQVFAALHHIHNVQRLQQATG